MTKVSEHIETTSNKLGMPTTERHITLIENELRATLNTDGHVVFEAFFDRKPYWFKSITILHRDFASDLSKGPERTIHINHPRKFAYWKIVCGANLNHILILPDSDLERVVRYPADILDPLTVHTDPC